LVKRLVRVVESLARLDGGEERRKVEKGFEDDNADFHRNI